MFKRLFEDLYGDLVNYANEYLYHVNSSEDVVQEVFIYLWENSEKIDIKTNIKGYLYVMVRNRCLNTLKSVNITDTARVFEMQAIFDPDYDPDHLFEEDRNPDYAQMLKILESLPSRMRAIVQLRFVNNYKYAEIADELGVSVNTIKTQLRRAKVKFAQLMISLAILLSML
ncbi:MAG: RNA polymerase sigma-70 factor [Bacteroidota bacterium]